jgi:hypothetical protein
MTYFYKIGGAIARKVGERPEVNEYVAFDKKHTLRHIKNGELINTVTLPFPSDMAKDEEFNEELMDLYKDIESSKIARSMLIPTYRKKKSAKPKSLRKVKVVKKCTCK